LPENGFVFCCFNNTYKLNPWMFDIWMRLLREVPGSVLWLREEGRTAAQNLGNEARARGVDPARVIFARRTPAFADHLARHRLADLFLDTLPYNAHTTASDALAAGLPLLTCAGSAYAGRVAGSLLRAIGLPELITTSLQDYEALALKLAGDRRLLADLRSRLERNLSTSPLFDTDRFRRHLEAAYTAMWERQQRGEPPRSFAVAPLEHGK
jgi:protein O-GlcNAc transferase